MAKETRGEVATHVLIPAPVAERLRELAKKTRVTQSEYLREAVVDLLRKYELTAETGTGEGNHA